MQCVLHLTCAAARQAVHRLAADLEEGDIELLGNADGGGDFVVPGAVGHQLAGVLVNDDLLLRHHAQAHDERPLHLRTTLQMIHEMSAICAWLAV